MQDHHHTWEVSLQGHHHKYDIQLLLAHNMSLIPQHPDERRLMVLYLHHCIRLEFRILQVQVRIQRLALQVRIPLVEDYLDHLHKYAFQRFLLLELLGQKLLLLRRLALLGRIPLVEDFLDHLHKFAFQRFLLLELLGQKSLLLKRLVLLGRIPLVEDYLDHLHKFAFQRFLLLELLGQKLLLPRRLALLGRIPLVELLHHYILAYLLHAFSKSLVLVCILLLVPPHSKKYALRNQQV